MVSKKCPKCGEDNPGEAVMCWACYTPLSGSAQLGAGLAAGAVGANAKTAAVGAPSGVPQIEEPAKKGIDPKMIGVGAFLLVVVGAVVMMSGMLGGGSSDPDPQAGGRSDPSSRGSSSSGSGRVGVAPPSVSGSVASGGAPPPPAPIPFKTVSSPGSGYKTGTLGILVTGNTTSPGGAAKFAKDQFSRSGRWANMQVAVFIDQATADSFAAFQRQNDNAPLTIVEFQHLAEKGVWNNCPAFLDTRGKQEKIYNPSQRPQAWWPDR